MRDGFDSTYRTSSWVLAIFTLVLSLLAMGFVIYRFAGSSAASTVENSSRFAAQLHESIRGQLSLYRQTIQSLASLSVYTAPGDYREYPSRLTPLERPRDVLTRGVITRAHESGYSTLLNGHLFRGLPLVNSRGREILVRQRKLALDAVDSLPDTEAIGEVDSLGRFVFAEPYAWQLSNLSFDIGRSDLFLRFKKDPSRWIVHTSLDGAGRHVTSFLAPIIRSGRVDGYLFVSVDIEKLMLDAVGRLTVPPSIISVESSYQPDDEARYRTPVTARGRVGFLQQLIAVLPRRLTRDIVPETTEKGCSFHLDPNSP